MTSNSIAIIRRRFDGSGGAELYTERLIAGLIAAGREVHLFAEAWPAERSAARVHLVDLRGTKGLASDFARAVERAVAPHGFGCVFSLERGFKQDIYRAGDGVHARFLEQKWRYSPWWRNLLNNRGPANRDLLALERETFSERNTKSVIVNSEMVRREIVAKYGYPDSRIHTVRNGVNTARFKRDADREGARAEFGLAPDQYVLAFVGSGWRRKGLPFVLRALPHVRNSKIQLLVAGKGRRPIGAPGNCRFLGPVAEVEKVFAAADCLITLPFYEPCANVVSEALAAALPVITSGFNGAGELLAEGKNRTVLADPRDFRGTAAAIDYWSQRRPTDLPEPAALDIALNVERTIGCIDSVLS